MTELERLKRNAELLVPELDFGLGPTAAPEPEPEPGVTASISEAPVEPEEPDTLKQKISKDKMGRGPSVIPKKKKGHGPYTEAQIQAIWDANSWWTD